MPGWGIVNKEKIARHGVGTVSQEPRMALSQEKDMVQTLSSEKIMLLPCGQKVG